jgi:hypothetical protein
MFLRDVGKMSPDEHILYNYWLVTLSLLEIGIPWTAIQKFTSDEIALVLAVNMARKEKTEENEMMQQKLAMNRR